MGVRKMMLLLLLLLFHFSFPTSFANHFHSGNQPEKLKDDSNGSTTGSGNRIVNQRKFSHAAGARGGAGGRSAGEGSNGNGGQTNSSPQGGGTAVIPVYTAASAGAAGQRKNHNGAAGISSRCRKGGLLVLIATAILLHISL